MTRCKLPAELGGGEIDVLYGKDGIVGGTVAGVGWITVPARALTPVPPPIPPEPEPGAIVQLASYFGVYERVDRGWLPCGEAAGKALTWDHLLRLNSGDTPVRLVPDPTVDVTLPWSNSIGCSVSPTEDDGLIRITGGVAFAGLTADEARAMAAALWAAADGAVAS